jgi:dihydrofolate synthase / folylpolyglutamate synthase
MLVLGDTIDKIAREKAGIIKPNTVVVTAPQAPEAMDVIQEVAGERHAEVRTVGRDIYISTDQLPEVVFDDEMVPQSQAFNVRFEGEANTPGVKMRVKTPLLGSHQQVNATVVLSVLRTLVEQGIKIDKDAIMKGLRNVQWPGRIEVIHRNPLVVADGAHNVDSIGKFTQAISEMFHRQRVVIVLGLSSDKDMAGIVGELGNFAGSFLGLPIERVIATKSNHPRAADPRGIVQQAIYRGLKAEMRERVPDALKRAEEIAANLGPNDYGQPVILVTGSLFLVAEAREFYGIAPDLAEEG